MLHHRMRRAVAGAGGGGGGIPLGANDVLYLRSDSTDESTDFTGLDLSSYGYTVAATAGIKHESTNALTNFGATSLYRSTTGALTVEGDPAGTRWMITSYLNFTVEFWVYPSSITSYQNWFGDHASSTLWMVQLLSSGAIRIYTGAPAFYTVITIPTGNLVANSWNHIAFDRYDGDKMTGYVGGVAKATATSNFQIGYVSTADFSVVNGLSNGLMDGIRFSRGTSLYNGLDFTPSPFPAI